MAGAVYKGEIPEDGIVSRLSEIEGWRTTGILRFEDGDKKGEVALVQGQISADQPEREDGDAVEVLLELRAGTFELIQQLPPLPVSKGDATYREGSLEVHVPADLMNYCERAGLTGVLEIRDGKQFAEIAYAKGELSGIRLDGLDELHEVFGWEEGTFRIEVRAQAPDYEAELSEPPPVQHPESDLPGPAADADATGKHFLKVVEVTLAEIVKEREQRRPATRTSPPLPPMSGPKKHPTIRPTDGTKRKERKDQTVRVIYLGQRDERPKAPTPTPSDRHPVTKQPASTKPATKKRGVSERKEPVSEEPIELPTIAWVGITLLVVIAALVLLANLPAIE